MCNLAELLQQTETLLNRGEVAEALSVVAQVRQYVEPPADKPETKAPRERIQEQRSELFGVMASIYVTAESINPDHDYDRHRVLTEAYDRLDTIATALDEIAGDVP